VVRAEQEKKKERGKELTTYTTVLKKFPFERDILIMQGESTDILGTCDLGAPASKKHGDQTRAGEGEKGAGY